jgi:DMSO/TMAO reductase YedYZ molybdopterin-dependent catalytic subunit
MVSGQPVGSASALCGGDYCGTWPRALAPTSAAQRGWTLPVGGLVRRPLLLDWARLLRWPARRVRADLCCASGRRLSGRYWEGVAVWELLRHAAPLPEATAVEIRAADYRRRVPLADMRKARALLAYRLDGQPLSAERGGPLRLVVPALAAFDSVKWVTALEVVAG